jgi:hypothetical protein
VLVRFCIIISSSTSTSRSSTVHIENLLTMDNSNTTPSNHPYGTMQGIIKCPKKRATVTSRNKDALKKEKATSKAH